MTKGFSFLSAFQLSHTHTHTHTPRSIHRIENETMAKLKVVCTFFRCWKSECSSQRLQTSIIKLEQILIDARLCRKKFELLLLLKKLFASISISKIVQLTKLLLFWLLHVCREFAKTFFFVLFWLSLHRLSNYWNMIQV